MTAPNFMGEVPLSQLTGDQLRARVARAQMYFIEMTFPDAPLGEAAQALQRDHLEFMYGLEKDAVLFGSGPVQVANRPAKEIAILAAPSAERAREIFEEHPLFKAGLCTMSVRSYTINEGVACYVARAMAARARSGLERIADDGTKVQPSLESFKARAASVPVFLVPLEPTEKPRPPSDMATMDAHFVWLRENEMSAKLLACGPLESAALLAPGVWGGGIGIFVTSRAEAERAAQVEPSGLAGYRALSVAEWTLEYGVAAPIAKAILTINTPPVQP